MVNKWLQSLRRSRRTVHQNIESASSRIPSTRHHEAISQHKKVLQVTKIEFELHHANSNEESTWRKSDSNSQLRAWLATDIYIHQSFIFPLSLLLSLFASTLTFNFLLPIQLSHFLSSSLTFKYPHTRKVSICVLKD